MQNTGLIRRLAAIVYDALLNLALWIIAALVFIGFNKGEAVETYQNLPLQIALATISFVFFVGYWTRVGRTLGMQSWGLQLETSDGQRPTLASASVRFFAALLSWAPAGLGFLWQLWDKDKLTWHDRISGTRLVYYPKEKK
jgi:uncharacterized RDD family membrane protein YckC